MKKRKKCKNNLLWMLCVGKNAKARDVYCKKLDIHIQIEDYFATLPL
jgi:hypothetical protein